IDRVAAVALFQRGTWVTLGQALGFGPGEGQTHALAVAEFLLESWDVVKIPTSVGRQRHRNRRQAYPGDLIPIRVDLWHQGRIDFLWRAWRMHPVLQHGHTIRAPWQLDIRQGRKRQR